MPLVRAQQLARSPLFRSSRAFWEDCLALMQVDFPVTAACQGKLFSVRKSISVFENVLRSGIAQVGRERMLCMLRSGISEPKYLPC